MADPINEADKARIAAPPVQGFTNYPRRQLAKLKDIAPVRKAIAGLLLVFMSPLMFGVGGDAKDRTAVYMQHGSGSDAFVWLWHVFGVITFYGSFVVFACGMHSLVDGTHGLFGRRGQNRDQRDQG